VVSSLERLRTLSNSDIFLGIPDQCPLCPAIEYDCQGDGTDTSQIHAESDDEFSAQMQLGREVSGQPHGTDGTCGFVGNVQQGSGLGDGHCDDCQTQYQETDACDGQCLLYSFPGNCSAIDYHMFPALHSGDGTEYQEDEGGGFDAPGCSDGRAADKHKHQADHDSGFPEICLGECDITGSSRGDRLEKTGLEFFQQIEVPDGSGIIKFQQEYGESAN